MLTLVESISLAGDRAKQNDDASGAMGSCAWVIDGATDLHETPITEYASDAAWIASYLNSTLYNGLNIYDIHGADEARLRREIAFASSSAHDEFAKVYHGGAEERWRLPTASVLIVSESDFGRVVGLDLGDSRCFALDANGTSHAMGGPDQAADKETLAATDAAKRAGGKPLLRDAQTMLWLRGQRSAHNLPGTYWVFGIQPECAEHARSWSLDLARPAHVLLATDGFAALVDRYGVYDAAGLIKAARERGLQELGRELRAIEISDAGGALHPRFKPSDDATALLLRLT